MAKAKFTQQQVRNYLQGKLQLIDRAIIRRLQVLGEKCVRHARLNGNYTDQTGNLRNSIGYVIVKHGEIIDRNFEAKVPGGTEGVKEGESLAETLAARYKDDGYVLIVVAGMHYAGIVETKYNRDVLTGAEIMAKTEFPRMMDELKKNVANMKP